MSPVDRISSVLETFPELHPYTVEPGQTLDPGAADWKSGYTWIVRTRRGAVAVCWDPGSEDSKTLYTRAIAACRTAQAL